MPLKEQLEERLERLLEKGEAVLRTHTPNPPNTFGLPTLDDEAYREWHSQSLACLTNLLGNHVYVEQFSDAASRPGYQGSVRSGLGVLRAVLEDIRGGYLTTVGTLIAADLFTDFLAMAAHLIEQGYKDPGASLTGAVLEEGLRRIAGNAGLSGGRNLESLNDVCLNNGIYNRLKSDQIRLWIKIRNHADHGDFNQYSPQDVEDMHRGVSQFLAEYLV